MLTQEQIEAKNFTLYTTSEESITNPLGDKSDYLAVGKFPVIQGINEDSTYEVPIILTYYTTTNPGLIIIARYYNNPLFFNDPLFAGKINTVEELDAAISKLKYELSEIDLTELADKYE